MLAPIRTLALYAACALLAVQTGLLVVERNAHRTLATRTAQADADRARAALAQTQKTTALVAAHTATTQKASDDFTTSQSARSDSVRADLVRLERLRLDAERRAASARAQAAAGTAACLGLADRLTALDNQLVEGIAVVGDLRGVVDRRDAEVALLRAFVNADRALLAD